MSLNRPTKGAIALGSVGALLFLIGLGLFISVFFSFASVFNDAAGMSPGFPSGFPSSGLTGPRMGSPMPIGRAAVGVAMMGLGAALVKAAIGLGLIGNAGSISEWFRQTLGGGPSRPTSQPAATVVKVRCKQCEALNDESARYCSSCGEAL